MSTPVAAGWTGAPAKDFDDVNTIGCSLNDAPAVPVKKAASEPPSFGWTRRAPVALPQQAGHPDDRGRNPLRPGPHEQCRRAG